MNIDYLKNELWRQKRRTVSSITGLALGVTLLLTINALSTAYREAARAPLTEIGADITVQRSGDVPRDMVGAVFPCSAVTLKAEETKKIASLKGVNGIGKALLLWVFDPNQAWVVLGIEKGAAVGPVNLKDSVSEGRFLGESGSDALVESAFAERFNIKTGDDLSVGGANYKVVGLVNASLAPKMAVANVYIGLDDARRMAVESPQVQSVAPFGPDDVNLLFIRADQRDVPAISSELREMMGKQATIAGPDSFLKQLGGVFEMFDRFAMVASLIAVLISALVTLKIMAGNINERAREIGILKAVGWTGRNVMSQLLGESLVQGLLGGLAGVFVAWLVIFGLSFTQISIPIPWDMSPVPHFLPGGDKQIFKTFALQIAIPWHLAVFTVTLSLLIGVVATGLLSRIVSRIKPAEVLRHE